MKRKIEAWTGPSDDAGSTMIGALVQAADGSIEQIDDSLSAALKGHVTSSAAPISPRTLWRRWKTAAIRDVHLEFPWEGTSE